jgi:hypothetical protein
MGHSDVTRDARNETLSRRALVALLLGASVCLVLSPAMPAIAAWLWLLGLALLIGATALAIIGWRRRRVTE